MQNDIFLPEGNLLHTQKNVSCTSSLDELYRAFENETLLEGIAVLCDAEHNLKVSLGEFCGTIPRSETAIGIDEGTTREIAIISRVGKPVTFIITDIKSDSKETRLILSRKKAQKKALAHFLNELSPGDIIPATVTHLENFGAFVDIGCGNISLLGIETISVSRISHPSDRFSVGDRIKVVVSSVDKDASRIYLSHRELMGTWNENVKQFEVGQTVRGIVRGIEDYGIFVELAPNLSGLAEYQGELKAGSCVSVYIKSIIPEKMKIKLIIIDVFNESFLFKVNPDNYLITENKISEWRYSPPQCTKKEISSHFA